MLTNLATDEGYTTGLWENVVDLGSANTYKPNNTSNEVYNGNYNQLRIKGPNCFRRQKKSEKSWILNDCPLFFLYHYELSYVVL